ncbi:MAG: outer membrane protein assembly factor BamA [Marinosulfonomonas sp.]
MQKFSMGCGRIAPRFSRIAKAFFVSLALTSVIAFDLASGAAYAQSESFRFSSVRIEGNRRIETATILDYIDIPRNEEISAGRLNASYQAVVGTGLFEEVEFTPNGNELIIKVQEYPTINRINIEGNKLLTEEDGLSIIESRPRFVYNPAQIERDADALAEAYQQQGRFAATVTPRIIRLSDNRVDVAFEVSETRNVEVERISFVGNRAFSDRRLRRVLASKQAGLLRALVRQDSFIPERLEFDKRVLADFYQSRGYVDIQVLSVSSEFSRERNGFFLTFNVREGQQFKFGDISASTTIEGLDPQEFLDAANVRAKNKVYTPVLVDRTITRMEQLGLRKGLNFLRVEPKVTRNDRDLTLDIDFVLTRGPRVFVERIDIEGNVTTLDQVIRRQFKTVEGDPFNPREIREAASRIEALDLFADSNVTAQEGRTPDQVVISVDVEEKTTGSLGFGAAYSAESGVGLTVNFQERNFLGRGQALNVALSFGLENSSYGFSFVEPAFLSRDLQFGFVAQYDQTQYDYTSYDTNLLKFQPSLAFPLSERSRIQTRYTWTKDRVFNVDSMSSQVLKAEQRQGAVVTSSVGYTYTYDSRNTGLDPTAGVLLRFGQDYSGLGGTGKWIKSTALALAERKTFNEEVTLRAVFEGGALLSVGQDSRITERFNISSRNIRGFRPSGAGPRDLTVPNEDVLGGNYFAVARLESEFPLGLPDEYGLTGALYLDVGSVWGLDNTANGAVDDSLHLRSSIGFGLIWDSAFGPLRVNLTKVLQKESYDETQVFELTVSTQF